MDRKPYEQQSYKLSLSENYKATVVIEFENGDHFYLNAMTEAQARLLANAPAMLAALERIVAIKGSTGGHRSMVSEFQFIAARRPSP